MVRRPNQHLPTVLLTDATWHSTLAALRDLGSRGVPAIVASDEWTAPARWSRYASTVLRCPPTADHERFLDWLLDFGARHPGCVYCPTSDDAAFLVATHRESLEPPLRLLSSSRESLISILDKGRLARAAALAGVKTPATWTPVDQGSLERAAREVPLPALVKPRTVVGSRLLGKGGRADSREELIREWWRARAVNRHQEAELGIPNIDCPIIQQYHGASERIYTVDGFVDESGTIVAAAACIKCLQFARRTGPGICFESAELDEEVLGGLQVLCRETGFVGVFDVEYLMAGEDKLLIDFNPRFYSHMAFEVERGLPLPWLAYLAALGDADGFREAVAALRIAPPTDPRVYVHRFPLAVMLAAQRATGHMTGAEVAGWRRLLWGRPDRTVDPVQVPGDRLPAYADAIHWLRHPRSFLRKAAAA